MATKYYLLPVDHTCGIPVKAQAGLKNYIVSLLQGDGYDYPGYYIEVSQEEMDVYKTRRGNWKDALDVIDYDYAMDAVHIAAQTWSEVCRLLPRDFSPYSQEAKDFTKTIYIKVEEEYQNTSRRLEREEELMSPDNDFPSEDETLMKELPNYEEEDLDKEGWNDDPKYKDEYRRQLEDYDSYNDDY